MKKTNCKKINSIFQIKINFFRQKHLNEGFSYNFLKIYIDNLYKNLCFRTKKLFHSIIEEHINIRK